MASEGYPAPITSDESATEGFPQLVSADESSPLALVDHRVRRRAVPAEVAPPGRYVAFEDGEATLLVALEEEITRIGRGLTADLRLDDGRVSRHHAILAQHGAGVRVLDDRSANGTFVNGRRVFQAEVEDGDVIRLGPVVLGYTEVRDGLRTTPRERLARHGRAAPRRLH